MGEVADENVLAIVSQARTMLSELKPQELNQNVNNIQQNIRTVFGSLNTAVTELRQKYEGGIEQSDRAPIY